MINADIFTILGFCFFGIAFFLGSFYALRDGLKDDGYIFLYLMLVILSYELFYKTLIHSKYIYSFSYLYISGRFFNLLVYPIFLFFVYSITRQAFRLRVQHWLLIIVVTAFIISNNYWALSLSESEKLDNLNRFYEDRRPGSFNYWANWKTLIKGTLYPLTFVSIIGYEYFRFRRENKNLPKEILLNILLVVISLFFLYNQLANILYKVLERSTGWSMIEWPVDITFLSVIIALLACLTLMVNGGAHFLPPSRYASSALDSEQYERIVTRVTSLIKDKQLFKDPELSLQKASKLMELNQSYLSQAINHHLGIRFNDFINQFRVDEAKRQLIDSSNAHLTIEAIAEKCGFQSKSTFYRTFKKRTGMTPKEYVSTENES